MRRALATFLGVLVGFAAFLPLVHGQAIPTPSSGGSSSVTFPFSDASFSVDDNGDGNELKWDLSLLSADRTVIWADAAGTVVTTASAPAFTSAISSTSAITLTGNNNFINLTNMVLRNNTAQTPDSGTLETVTNSNAVILMENGDSGADCAHALQTNPTLFIHSATICSTSTTEYAAYTHLGQAPNQVTVTVDAATTFAITTGYVDLQCTGAETINTITGGVEGLVLYLENTDTECTIADDETPTAANAIDLTGAANDVGAAAKVLTLVYNGTHWKQVSESDN
jgi:hypothetical protein